MNCGEFDQRMQRLLDDRISLASDDLLSAHASWCGDCRDRMQVWERIETVVPMRVETPTDDHRVAVSALRANTSGLNITWSMFAAVAAVLLLAFLIGYSRQNDDVTVVANNAPVNLDEELAVDPASWWRDVQDRDWLGETMPAMQSVRDGVAPLGRSLKQALAILTTGSGEKTS